jgi:hypothetical protein
MDHGAVGVGMNARSTGPPSGQAVAGLFSVGARSPTAGLVQSATRSLWVADLVANGMRPGS